MSQSNFINLLIKYCGKSFCKVCRKFLPWNKMYKHAKCTNKQGLQTKCTSKGLGQKRTTVVLVTSVFVKVRTKGEGRGSKIWLICVYVLYRQHVTKKAPVLSVPFVRRYLLKKKKCRINDSEWFDAVKVYENEHFSWYPSLTLDLHAHLIFALKFSLCKLVCVCN